MISMDVGSLIRLGLPIALLCGLVQLAVGLRSRRSEPLLWAASDVVGLVGGGLLTVPATPAWLAMTVGNTLIIVSQLLVWAGLRRGVGLGIPTRRFATIALAFFVVFCSLWLVGNDLGLRVLTVSITLSVGNALIAYDLARGGDQSDRRIRGTLSLLFSLHALFFLFRAATAMTLEAEDEFMRAGGLQAITVLVATLKLLLWNAGALVLLRGDRGRGSEA